MVIHVRRGERRVHELKRYRGRKPSKQVWENQVKANWGPGEEAQQARNEGYITIEEANWTDVVQLPMFHESQAIFSYP